MAVHTSPHVSANRRRYARIAPFYDRLDSLLEKHYRPGRARIGAAALGVTIEVGAGTGKNFPFYAERARVFASDLSEAMLTQALGKRTEPVRLLVVGEAAALPFGDAVADTVVATFVCCVQDDPAPSLAAMARVLKPGGRVLCLDYTIPTRPAVRIVMRLLEPMLRVVYGIHWDHDIPRLLEAAGLHVREVRQIWGPAVRFIAAERPLST